MMTTKNKTKQKQLGVKEFQNPFSVTKNVHGS